MACELHINNTVETALNRANIDSEVFNAWIDVCNDMLNINPDKQITFNLDDIVEEDLADDIVSKMNKFFSNKSNISFLNYLANNDIAKSVFQQYYQSYSSIANPNNITEWQYFINAFFKTNDLIEKLKKEKITELVKRTFNRQNVLLNRISSLVQLSNSQGKDIEAMGKITNIVYNNEALESKAIEMLSYDGDILNNDEYKQLLKEFFKINLTGLSDSMTRNEFTKALDSRIKGAIASLKYIKNKKAMMQSVNDLLKLYTDRNNLNQAGKLDKETDKHYGITRLKKTREFSKYPDLEYAVTSMFFLDEDGNVDTTLFDLLRDKMIAQYNYNKSSLNVSRLNGQMLDKKETKLAYDQNVANLFYPFFAKNIVPDNIWEDIVTSINGGTSIKTFIERFESKDSNTTLMNFLKGLDSYHTPNIDIIKADTLPESKIKDSVVAHERNYGHKPSAIYVTDYLNKQELQREKDTIYLIDDGTTEHSFSLSTIAHEWLHGLTVNSFRDKSELSSSIEVCRTHAIEAFINNKVNMKGLDYRNLDMVKYNYKGEEVSIPYALTNSTELISEVFNNKELQKLLDRIKSPFKAKKKQSLWGWLLEQIKSLVNDILTSVGHKNGTNTVLSELLITGSTAMQLSLTRNNDINEVISDDVYGTFLSPTMLPQMTPYMSDVINNTSGISNTESILLEKCNNVITPQLSNDEEDIYSFSEEFVENYNKEVAPEDYINNKSYNADTRALLHFRNDISAFSKKEVNTAIEEAIKQAREILNLGGAVITVSQTEIQNNPLENVINATIYNTLLNEGYTPNKGSEFTPYQGGDFCLWVKEPLTEEDRALFELDAKTMRRITPFLEKRDGSYVMNPTVDIVEKLKVKQDGFTIKSDSPFYEQAMALTKGDNIQIHSDNMYYGKIEDIVKRKNGNIEFTVNFQLSPYTEFAVNDIDTSIFDKTDDLTVKFDSSVELKLGSQKTKWRVNMIADDLISNIRMKLANITVPDNYDINDESQKAKLELLFASNDFESICNELKSEYERYINDPDFRLEREKTNIRVEAKKFNLNLTEEKITERATNRLDKKVKAFKEMLPYFTTLTRKAAKKVAKTFDLSMSFYNSIENLEEDSTDGSIEQEIEQTNEDYTDEVSDASTNENEPKQEDTDSDVVGKDHWVTSAAHRDIHETVNARVKKILSNIYKKSPNGKVQRDDLGNILYDDERDVFNTLEGVVAGLQSVKDMMAAIKNYAEKGHSNYFDVLSTLENNEELQSLFFTGLCSQRKNLESITGSKKNQDAEYLYYANKDAKYDFIQKGVESLLRSKQPNTIAAINYSVVARIALKEISKLSANELVSTQKVDKLQNFLNIIGVNLSKDDLLRSISRKDTDIFNYVVNIVKDVLEVVEKSSEVPTMASLSNYYKNIASILKDSIPVAENVRTYCEGNLYPTFNRPSFISRLFDKINNFKTLKERQAYMNKEFKQFSQYYTQSNLDEMIESAKLMAKSNPDYTSLANYLNSLKDVENTYGDKEVANRLTHISELVNEETATLLSNLTNKDGVSLTYTQGQWNYIWLEQMYNNLITPYKLSDMISYKGKDYTNLNEKEYLSTMFKKAEAKKDKIGITVPIYADANCWNFIYCKSVTEEEALNAFERIMVSEIKRIKCANERWQNRLKAFEAFNKEIKRRKDNKESIKDLDISQIKGFTYPIPNYDIETKDGIVYKKDGSIDIEKSSVIKKVPTYQYFTYKVGDGTMKEQIKKQLESDYKQFLDYAKSKFKLVTYTKGEMKVSYPGLPEEDFLRTFFINHCYNTSQLLGITSFPAFYKNAVDFQKRYKEVYALTQRLNVWARGGRRFERTITFSDRIVNEFKDAIYKIIAENIDKILNQAKHLTPANKAYIKKKLGEINVTDAQALRTASSYAAIKTMLGEWGEDMQKAWINLNSGKFNKDNMKLLMQVIKPFLRSSYVVSSGTDYGNIKVPLQHKNSEFMSPFGSNTNLVASNRKQEILRAITDFMEDNFIDVANFESAVKVGNQAPIDVNDCESYQDTLDLLYKVTGCKKLSQQEREQLKQQIEQETDTPVIIGNPEVVKTISYEDWGIVAPNPEHFTDKRMKIGSQIRRIMVADLLDDENYELEEINWEVFTGQQLQQTTDKDKKEIVDLRNITKKKGIRVVSTKTLKGSQIRELYNKIIQDNLSLSYKKLEDLFQNKDKLAAFLDETITNDDKLSDDLKRLIIRDKDGNFTNMCNGTNTEKIHQILMSKIRHTVTEQKIAGGTCVQVSCMFDDSLSLHFTEDSKGNTIIEYADCYLPLYMKSLYTYCLDDNGFFDIDKLKKECAIRNDMATFEALTNMIGYRTPTEGVSSAIPLRVKGFLPVVSGSCIMLPKEITFLSGSDFDVDKLYIMRHEFEIGKDGFPKVVTDNSIKGNNNKLLDLMLSLMKTQQYTEKFLNPSGSFDDLKKTVNILSILNNTKPGEVDVEQLKQLDPDSVEDYIKDKNIKIAKNDINLLSPTFQPYYHSQNFTGKNMLSIWAVYKSATDLLQYAGIKLSHNATFNYNGETKDSLCPQTIKDGNVDIFLTSIVKQYLAASADNTKDPVQFKMGITKDNINAVAYLTLLGLDSTSVALIIRAANMIDKSVWAEIDSNSIAKELASLGDKTLAYPDHNTALAAAYLLNKAMSYGQELNDLVSILREDSQKGALKKDIYSTMSFLQKIKRVNRKLLEQPEEYPFRLNSDMKLIDTSSVVSSKVQNKSLIGNVQQFYDYGVKSYTELTKGMFAEFSDTFQNIIDTISDIVDSTLYSNKIQDIANLFWYYNILRLPFFGEEKKGNKELITGIKKLNSYKENMPSYFKEMMIKYPELFNNDFLKRLQFKEGVNTEELTLPNVYQYNVDDTNDIKIGISELFMSDNPEIRKFAWNLLKYDFYRHGVKRVSDGWNHLIPMSIWSAIPGYGNLMKEIQQSANINVTHFVMQYFASYDSKGLPYIKLPQYDKKTQKLNDVLLQEIEKYEINKGFRPTLFKCGSYIYETSELTNPNYKGIKIPDKAPDSFLNFLPNTSDESLITANVSGETIKIDDTTGRLLDMNVKSEDNKGVYQRNIENNKSNPNKLC